MIRRKAKPATLHQRLIAQACATAGWKPNPSGNGWRKAFRAMLDDARWIDERDDMLEFVSGLTARPDAWRIRVRDEDAMLFLEFLEVEVFHHISEDKKDDYLNFWWRIDGSDGVRLQIWRMDRFGVISDFMTEETIHTFDSVIP